MPRTAGGSRGRGGRSGRRSGRPGTARRRRSGSRAGRSSGTGARGRRPGAWSPAAGWPGPRHRGTRPTARRASRPRTRWAARSAWRVPLSEWNCPASSAAIATMSTRPGPGRRGSRGRRRAATSRPQLRSTGTPPASSWRPRRRRHRRSRTVATAPADRALGCVVGRRRLGWCAGSRGIHRLFGPVVHPPTIPTAPRDGAGRARRATGPPDGAMRQRSRGA